MLNIRNIDLTKRYRTTEDELKSLKSYIYQLVEELQYRYRNTGEYASDGSVIIQQVEAATPQAVREALAAAKAYADAVAGGGGDTNVIEIVKVNGVALVPDSTKAVDVIVPTYTPGNGIDITDNVISVNIPDGDNAGYGG